MASRIAFHPITESIRVRYLVLFAVWFSIMTFYVHRSNITVAILDMMSISKDKLDCSESDPGANDDHADEKIYPFNWDEKLAPTITGAYFYGYAATHFIGGIISAKIGCRLTMSVCIAGTTLFTFLNPILADWDPYALIAGRLLSGLFSGPLIPVTHEIVGIWSPDNERFLLSSATYSGSMIGLIANYGLSAALLGTENGWRTFFYISGVLGLISLIFWFCFVFDSPFYHPYISNKEIMLITKIDPEKVRKHGIELHTQIKSTKNSIEGVTVENNIDEMNNIRDNEGIDIAAITKNAQTENVNSQINKKNSQTNKSSESVHSQIDTMNQSSGNGSSPINIKNERRQSKSTINTKNGENSEFDNQNGNPSATGDQTETNRTTNIYQQDIYMNENIVSNSDDTPQNLQNSDSNRHTANLDLNTENQNAIISNTRDKNDQNTSNENQEDQSENLIPSHHLSIHDVPFRKMFKSFPIWTLNLAQFGNTFILYSAMTGTPKFLSDAYGMTSTEAGIYSMIPFFFAFLCQVSFPVLLKYIKKRRHMEVGLVCKICSGIGFFGSAISVSLAGIYTCTHLPYSLFMLTSALIFYAININGYYVSMIDIAPSYSGITMGISNTFGSFGGFIAPQITGALIKTYKIEKGWLLNFIISGVLAITAGLPYLIFGTNQLQPWSLEYKAQKHNQSNSSTHRKENV